LFADRGGEYVTSLSIGPVTLCGVLTHTVVMCMHEGHTHTHCAHTHTLFSKAQTEDRVMGI